MPRFNLLILMVVAAGLAPGCKGQSKAPPANNALVGLSESAVRSQLGQPSREFPGHYGLPTDAFVKSFTGEVKTSTFDVRGGGGGTEYVSFEKRQGGWVAICNHWLPAGGAF